MKKKSKIILSNKSSLKHPEPNINRNRSEKSLDKKFFSNIFTKKNLEFLQSLNFSKPVANSGDADSYFKQTLRNYEYFDLSFLNKPKRPVKLSKSLEFLQKSVASPKRKARSKYTASVQSPTKTQSCTVQQVTFEETEKKKEEDLDVDVFYSPSTHSLTSQKNFEPENEKLNEVEDQSENTTSSEMAEESDYPEEFEELNIAALPGDTTEEEEEGEADELKQVDKMIKQASQELAEVTEGNQEFLEAGGEGEDIGYEDYEESGEETAIKAAGDGSVFKFDPAIDAAVLRELEEAEKQAKQTAKIIYELKTRVTELLKKEKHTEAEAKELEEKNKELKAQMLLFEEKTKRIQFLIAQTNLFDKMIPPEGTLQTSHNEDVLPKVIVCGMTEHNIPKLILCDDKKKRSFSPKRSRSSKGDTECNIPMSVVPQFAKRLSDSYTMQERLAAENADLEGMRYKLQSDLLNKDQTIEYLQRKLGAIQCEMRMLSKENSILNERVQQICTPKPEKEMIKQKRGPCGKGKGPCPADIEYRLNEYSTTTKMLEQQLCDMENDVRTMQTELTAVQAEREHMEQHKKVLICPPCAPPCLPCSPCILPCAEQQLRELREQYCRLQDDYKSKLCEVACLRADNDKLKVNSKECEEARKMLEDKNKDLERTVKSLKLEQSKVAGSKEQLIEQEQQLAVAKQRFREAQDELEELRSFIQDQQAQLDDYRNKYLEAQQQVEEQKRQIDMLEMDANRVNEQVSLEIQRVKNQFQEKLQELLPLPDLLKTTQLKLQEAQQMHLLAERNNEALNRDLQLYKEKIEEINEQMSKMQNDNEFGQGEKQTLAAKIEELEARVNELEDYKFTIEQDLAKTEEVLQETQRELQAKLHEIAQLSAQLESVREESARQVARNKDRCETVRRSMQNQISDLERQLAQSRAQARAAQKDRDEIRQKMQMQINNLHENFEDAQMRIRNLQGHVNFLKETYHTNVPGIEDTDSDHQDPCNCGREF